MKVEKICLMALDYKLNYFSSYYILEFFLNNGVLFEHEICNDVEYLNSVTTKIINFFLEDIRYLDFSPIHIACAVITLARDLLKIKEPWSNIFTKIYGIKHEDFINCYFVLKRYIIV